MNLSENGKSEMRNTLFPLHLKRNLIGFIVLVLDFSLAFVGWIMYLNHLLKESRLVGLLKANPIEDLNHKTMECQCGKKSELKGSPSSGWYLLCSCNKVGYFEDSKGNEIYYQDKSNSDEG